MSQTFHLVCPDTKVHLWIGQGWGEMTALYTEDAYATRLTRFLNSHRDKELRFLCADTNDWIYDAPWQDFEDLEEAKP